MVSHLLLLRILRQFAKYETGASRNRLLEMSEPVTDSNHQFLSPIINQPQAHYEIQIYEASRSAPALVHDGGVWR
jgi:hypothetical protein